MLKMAICRGDVQILALILVSLIEDRQLIIDQDSDALTLAIQKHCSLDIVQMLCQVGFLVKPTDINVCKN